MKTNYNTKFTTESDIYENISDEEIDAFLSDRSFLDEIEDDEIVDPGPLPVVTKLKIELVVDNATPASQPKDLTESVVEPTLELSSKSLINRGREIALMVHSGEYNDELGEELLKIEKVLIERGDNTPRKYQRYNPKLIKDKAVARLASNFMNTLQVIAMYWVWYNHEGHSVDCQIYNGMFEGIFDGDEDDEFDFDLAYKIAIGNFVYENATEKQLGHKIKATAMRIPIECSRIYEVYQTDTLRMKLKRESDKEKSINDEAFRIEERLREHAAHNPKSQLSEDRIITHKNVWVAMQLTNKSPTLAVVKYKELTGEDVSLSFIKNRVKNIKKILKLK